MSSYKKLKLLPIMVSAVAVTSVFFLSSGSNGNVAIAASKVTICHKTSSVNNPWNQITVSENALPAHQNHGDFVVTPTNVCPPPPCPVNDTIADADGTASPGNGVPGAVEVTCGARLTRFPAVFNNSGLSLINDDDATWEPGDDLMVEGLAFCPTGINNQIYDAGFDCVVLDPNGDLVNGTVENCDVETAGCGLSFFDTNGNVAWDNGEDIVLDGNGDGIFN